MFMSASFSNIFVFLYLLDSLLSISFLLLFWQKLIFPSHPLLYLTYHSCWSVSLCLACMPVCMILWCYTVDSPGTRSQNISCFLDFLDIWIFFMCIFVPFSESEMITFTIVFFYLFILYFLPPILCCCSSNSGSNKGSSHTICSVSVLKCWNCCFGIIGFTIHSSLAQCLYIYFISDF